MEINGKPKLAEVLKKKLYDSGRNVSWLAQEVRVEAHTLRNWLRGNVFPDDPIMASICQILDLGELPDLTGQYDFRWHKSRRGRQDGLVEVLLTKHELEDVNLMPLIKFLATTDIDRVSMKDMSTLISLKRWYPFETDYNCIIGFLRRPGS